MATKVSLLNQEIWEKNVSQYVLVDTETGKTAKKGRLLNEDAALLNRVYARENRGQEWREVDWKKKTTE